MSVQRPSWQIVWEDGFLPCLTLEGLQNLATALQQDDAKLLQGATTQPPPLMCVQDWPAEGSDPLGFTGVHLFGGWGSATVGQLEEHFARLCFEADQRLGEPAACRWFLNWWDDTPRATARKELFLVVGAGIEHLLANPLPVVGPPTDTPPAAFVANMMPTPGKTGEQIAREYREKLRQTEYQNVDAAELLRCATMLDTYAPELYPATDIGQVDFARGVMESVADTIRMYLVKSLGIDAVADMATTADDEDKRICTPTEYGGEG